MAQIKPVTPVKFFIAILTPRDFEREALLTTLSLLWGVVDYVSPSYDFECTDYYENEMGPALSRFFVSFRHLIAPESIAAIKLMTHAMEWERSVAGNRPFNLDPGYLDYQKVVLASLKFGGQKIHINQGVYADLTLYYRKGSFTTFPWTFPDFQSPTYYSALLEIRRLYKQSSELEKISD